MKGNESKKIKKEKLNRGMKENYREKLKTRINQKKKKVKQISKEIKVNSQIKEDEIEE